jgi:Ca2+/Na+ antiporter
MSHEVRALDIRQCGRQVFVSKRDRWLSLVLLLTSLAILSAAMTIVARVLAQREPLMLPQLVIFLLALALLAWVYFGTSYAVSEEALSVRSGPFRWVIRTGDITQLSASRDPSSAPALSLDRISVHYRAGHAERQLLVSPLHRPAFVSALLSVNAGIAVTDC